MSIIIPFHGGVIIFLAENLNWNLGIIFHCPHCNCRTHKHGKYMRTIYSYNESYIIPIYRRFCPNCKTTFSLIPSFIKPYARFLNSYRFNLLKYHVVDGVSIKRIPAKATNFISTTTFRRWLKKLKGVASNVNKFLIAKLLDIQPGLPPPKGNLSDTAFILKAGETLRLIVQALLPSEPSGSYGVFDMLNILLPTGLLV